MHAMRMMSGLLLLACLAACAKPPVQDAAPAAEPQADAKPMPAPGSDRDAHGCIPSAGYAWCARSNQCERPWELAKVQSFENTAAAFDKYCAAPAKP